MTTDSLALRYGINPHQQPARAYTTAGALPFRVLNGQPGMINLLDALNAWGLVRDMRQALGMPAAASFKHVSPAGAAVGVPLGDVLRQACFVGDRELTPLAAAYARARGADRVSSFGDWIALSDVVDRPTAALIRREVSDGVIAPGYEPDALELLKKKKGGGYRILAIDPDFVPAGLEIRDVGGVVLEQPRNTYVPTTADLTEIVTQNTALPASAQRDMLVALIALKYTQSNSVCFAYDGQIIGMGAGQQSRIHCTRLAGSKAETWLLRQHPAVLNLPFRDKIGRPERDNAIDQYLLQSLTPAEETHWRQSFKTVPERLSAADKQAWIERFDGIVLGSDAFFPFRDSIDRAQRTGVSYVVQPGGSVRDQNVIDACDDYGMVMVTTGVRLFHH